MIVVDVVAVFSKPVLVGGLVLLVEILTVEKMYILTVVVASVIEVIIYNIMRVNFGVLTST